MTRSRNELNASRILRDLSAIGRLLEVKHEALLTNELSQAAAGFSAGENKLNK
jgi:hypothetical protein